MDIHEYQAKEILSSFGVTVPRGGIVYSPETAENKAREIGGSKWVVKAQIHSGARGKAGGVIVCNNPLEVAQATDKLLGKKLVTNQTGPEGKIVNRIYIEEATDIEKELYLGLVFDRSSESIMVVASTEGGMSVEEIAKEKPKSIIRSKIEVAVGIQSFQARELAFGLGIEPELIRRVSETIIGCAKAFSELDATMVEVNPLVISKQKQILALDCKMSFDNNAMFRRDKVSELRDKTQEDEKEVYADWGFQNRTCGLRVSAPGRFEYRSVDSMHNPYLMGAALLKTMDDGISNNIDPGKPESRNIYEAQKAGKEVKKLPLSLGEALDRLSEDKVVQSAMPDEMYKIFHWYKNDEWEKFLGATTQWDLDTYLDCLP